MKKILVTGAAGFIGSWTCRRLVDAGHRVVGVDNFSPYYDVSLKRDRVKNLIPDVPLFSVDIADREALNRVFDENPVDQICHLAAQAGVRHSLKDPFTYESTNNLGTLHLLEIARHLNIKSFVFASSSSVYGGNTKVPFSVEDSVDRPFSLYAATKKNNELTSHAYHHLFGLHCTGLRFFTVYGPWGRPDMALFTFTRDILAGVPIDVYNHGKMQRDFTFIDDIVTGVVSSLDHDYPYEIFNLGNSTPVELMSLIALLEKTLNKKAKINFLPMQPGDVPATWADIQTSTARLGFKPQTSVETGVQKFVDWYRTYYKV